MNNGWRSRFMAPGYALVISFLLVVILGAVLNDPMPIQFTIPESGVSKQHVKELSEVSVSLGAADPGAADGGKLTEEQQLGPSLEFTVLKPNEKNIRICTTLPTSWSPAEEAEVSGGKTCWKREKMDKVVIKLNDQIRIRFTILNGSKQYAKELQGPQGLSVLLKAPDGRQPTEKPLDSSSLEFTVLNPHEKFQICTTLPPRWSPAGVSDGKRCLEYEATGEDVEIPLSRQGG